MAPTIQVVPSNQPPDRAYKGGKQIREFRGEPPCDEYQSEDWVASTTCCGGEKTLGLSKLPNGEFLIDEIKKDANGWLGPSHQKEFGTNTKLLVKLLDAGQRLPIHAHPPGDWARKHLNEPRGKAEAWFILQPGHVYLGLKESLTQDQLQNLVDSQDVEKFLGLMHKIPVKRYQTVYVPPGVLHSIEKGVLVAEVQEPADLSIFCNWQGLPLDGTKDGHLGLGFEVALTAVEKEGRSQEQMRELVADEGSQGSVFSKGHGSAEYFDIQKFKVSSEQKCAQGFSIMIVLDGDLEVVTDAGSKETLKKGSTTVMPYSEGSFSIRGDGEVLVIRPPHAS